MAQKTLNKRPWWKHWWGILILLFLSVFLFIIVVFLQQFFKFYSLALKGEISTADASFLQQFTIDRQLSAKALKNSVRAPEAASLVVDDNPQFGPPTALLTIVEFADFGCPYSKEAAMNIRELADKYADKIHYVYRDFPIDELHPDARAAAEAARCAQELGNFWSYHDKLYQNQDRFKRDNLIKYALEIGLDEKSFIACIDNKRYGEKVQRDVDAGIAAGVRGTPTFFINGAKVEGSIPRDTFDKLLESVLQ